MSEQEKVKLTINGLLSDLKNGLTREDIAEKYSLTKADVKRIFQHPKLKNKKTIKPREESWVLVDDTEDEGESQQATAESPEDSPEETVDETVEESDDVFRR